MKTLLLGSALVGALAGAQALAETKPTPSATSVPSVTGPQPAAPSSFADHTGIEILAGAGINLLSFPSNVTNVSNRMSLMGHASVNYFFTSNWGAFAGVQLVSRGFKGSATGDSSTATFADIPFGLAIGLPWSSIAARSLIRIGGYYAVNASSDFSGPLSLAGIGGTKTKGFFGGYIDHSTTFRLADHIGLGYLIWGKIPLGSAHSGTLDHNFYETGLGFVLSYQ